MFNHLRKRDWRREEEKAEDGRDVVCSGEDSTTKKRISQGLLVVCSLMHHRAVDPVVQTCQLSSHALLRIFLFPEAPR